MWPTGDVCETKLFRLPEDVRPTHYDIHLDVDPDRESFAGTETVSLEIAGPTQTITVHAKNLTVRRASVLYPVSDTPAWKRQEKVIMISDAERDRVVIGFPEKIPSGPANLVLDFEGRLSDQLAGAYVSTYDAGGKKRRMITTQFEDTDARRAFPCFDEPGFKATFELALTIPSHLDAVSNTPMVSQTNALGATKTVRFAKTPKMSTYLLAFLVGNFESIEGKAKQGTDVRILMTPGKSGEGTFALDTAIRCLEFYENYFGIPYPLPKLDMAAIPDFAFGAMENWGLITYRESRILEDAKNTAAANREDIALVICHEIAHQWFGNLVTMDWWTQLWLNEGFATWMEYLAVDILFPKWHVWEHFIAHDWIDAKAADALRSTHPVEIGSKDPAVLRQYFDDISYKKGASIICMIYTYTGADAFRAGLSLYLNRHAYANATTEDLWAALEEASGKPVRTLMGGWTKQAGYPVIVATEMPGGWRLEQRRFLASGKALTADEESQQWEIPLSILTGKLNPNNSFAYVWRTATLSERAANLFFLTENPRWLIANRQASAFARVAYPESNWENLRENIYFLSPTEHLTLLDDCFALARAGYQKTTALLAFLEGYRGAREYMVCSEVVSVLAALKLLFPYEPALDAFARSIVRATASNLGWEEKPGESHETRMLRPMMLGACVEYGDPASLEKALSLFGNYRENPESVPANLRNVALHGAATVAGGSVLIPLLDLYRSVSRSEEKNRILSALGAVRNEFAMRDVVEFAFSPDVRMQDVIRVLDAAGPNPYAREHAWKHLRDHWDDIAGRYEAAINLLGRMVEAIAGHFSTFAEANAVEAFFKEHPAPKISRSIAKALERARIRAHWFERDGAEAAAWLQRWYAEHSE